MTFACRTEATKLWSQSWATGFPGWDDPVNATGLRPDSGLGRRCHHFKCSLGLLTPKEDIKLTYELKSGVQT